MSAHVLVVDDDADLLKLLSMRLTAAGHRVSAVQSAEAALLSWRWSGRRWC
jgi:two-component system response regulator GlrR